MDKPDEKKYMVELTQIDLELIHDIFDELTRESLDKWLTLLPKKGEYRSIKCFQQWLITGQFDNVRCKAGLALGYGKEVTDEELDGI